MSDKSERYHHGDLKNALIEAAIEILAEEGVQGLSLRKVAARAGVSHAAPYAHFTDKQALIAAVSTEGYKRMAVQLQNAIELYPDDPLRQLVEGGWAYIEFGLDDPAHFKITLSGVVEKENDYPSLVEATNHAFRLLESIVDTCQHAGILRPAQSDLMAVSIWSVIHGLVTLALDAQISHVVLEKYSMRQLLLHALGQFILVEIPAELYALP
jgi:AcrR family transcriptional regulator